MTPPFPVHYAAEKPPRFSRVMLVVRLIAAVVLGMLGFSLGILYVIAYFALPGYAALRLARRDGATYLAEDGPRIVRALRWFAAVYAWFGLVAEHFPSDRPDEEVHVDVEPSGTPTAVSALWRLITGIPSAIVLAILGWLGALVWLWAALMVLVRQEVGSWTYDYLTGVQRWSIRLLAYQGSLVQEYPPFSFQDVRPPVTTAP